jgi:uncharacterized membrane protein YkoI
LEVRHEREDDMDRKRVIAAAAIGVALVGGGAAVAVAASGDDEPLTGDALDRATDAALAHTGGGIVVESEIGDDGAAYEVEVELPDGSVVEVALDAGFEVIDETPDDDGSGGEEEDLEED